jgi:ribonuclease HI
VAILISKALHAVPIHLDCAVPPLDTEDLEAIAAAVELGTTTINVASVYMPRGPTQPALDGLAELISVLGSRQGLTLIGGDFNAHHVRWDRHAVVRPRKDQALADLIDDAKLSILNNGEPTFVSRAHGTVAALDLTLCDPDLERGASWTVADPVVASDHNPVITRLLLPSRAGQAPQPPRTVWTLRRADWKAFEEDGAPWREWLRTANRISPIDDLYASWLTVFQRVALQHVGARTYHGPPPARQPAWRTQAVRDLQRARNRARKRLRRRPTPANRRAWITAMKAARDAVREAREASLGQLAEELHKARTAAPAVFWQRFNKEMRPQSSCASPPVRLPSGQLSSSDTEAAIALNSHFSSVGASREAHAAFCTNCRADPAVLAQYRNNASAFAPQPGAPAAFTRAELDSVIAALRTDSAGGPDTVLPVFLKNAGGAMRDALLVVINASWTSGRLPRLWKAANVKALIKAKAEDTRPSSFRPISLTSVVGKLCERLVYNRILPLVAGHLPQHQSGFRRARSTLDCITRFTLAATEAFERNEDLVGVFVDMDKAYDTVWRKGLLVKLLAMGLDRHALAWVADFLRNRVQRTCVGTALSPWALVEDGVPQGSVLSCLLYLAFTHDILGPDADDCASYADDLLLWGAGKTAFDAAAPLQPRLTALQRWAGRNLCHVSSRKTVYTVFSKRDQGSPADPDPVLVLGEDMLRQDRLPKYLGVTLSPDLSWGAHLRSVELPAQRTLAAIRRLCGRGHRGASPAVMLSLIRALLDPLLEYAAPIWHGAPSGATSGIDRLKHQALVAACGVYATSSTDALTVDAFALPPELRRDLLSLRWEGRILRLEPDHPLRRHWVERVLPRMLDGSIVMSWRRREGGSLPQRLVTIHRRLRVDYEAPEKVEPLGLQPTALPAWPSRTLCPTRESAPALAWAAGVVAQLQPRAGVAVVFTDGSFDLQSGAAAAACSVSVNGAAAPVERASSLPNGLVACSFAAEIAGIMLAMDALLGMLEGAGAGADLSAVHLFCDSRAALDVLSGRAKSAAYTSLCNAATALLDRLQHLVPVSFYWIPSHCGIPENERVDAAAKAALARDPTGAMRRVLNGVRVSLSVVAARSRLAVFNEWCRRWALSESAVRHLIPIPVPPHGRWSSSRRRDVTLCRLRLGQCLNEFLHRVFQAPSPACAMHGCRDRESVEHFLLHCIPRNPNRAHLLHVIRDVLAGLRLDDIDDATILSLPFLLGSTAPVSVRSAVGDAVFRYYNDCSSP